MKPLVLALFLLGLVQSARASLNCTEYLRRHGSFQLHRFEAQDGTCYLSADPFNPPASFIYRSFLMTSEGLLMVFNSYGPEETSDMHGARVFYFFPRSQTPESESGADFTEVKWTTPGLSLLLSLDQHKVLGMRGGRVKEALKISPNNKGGIEFSNVGTLYLDAGFTMGQDPTGLRNRDSKFIDSKGQTCDVKNSEVFKYASDGEPSFKFTDPELKSFLASRCPGLTVNF
jgi:hypothetical protein